MPSQSDEPGAEAERVIARLRPHARVLFWPSLAMIVGIAAVSYFAGSFAEEWQNWLLLAAGGLVAVLVWLIPLLAWLSKRYVITSRRIIVSAGIGTRVRQELLHSRGYDVTVRKAGLQALFGSGDILVNTGLDHPVVLRDIPSANLVQAALHDLMEKSMNPIAARRQAEASHAATQVAPWGTR